MGLPVLIQVAPQNESHAADVTVVGLLNVLTCYIYVGSLNFFILNVEASWTEGLKLVHPKSLAAPEQSAVRLLLCLRHMFDYLHGPVGGIPAALSDLAKVHYPRRCTGRSLSCVVPHLCTVLRVSILERSSRLAHVLLLATLARDEVDNVVRHTVEGGV